MQAAELRGYIETDLGDAELEAYYQAELEVIDKRLGDPVDHLKAFGLPFVLLRRQALTITSVTVRSSPDADEVTLAADDYRLFDGRELIRLSKGTNPASSWYGELVITYVPVVDAALHQRVAIDLCKLAIEHKGVSFEATGGGTSTSFADYQAAREKVLAQISGRQSILA